METGAVYENLEREYRSAGGFWIRYADIQVLKSRDADAIERLTKRKARQIATGQIGLWFWALVQVPHVLADFSERGWAGSGASTLLFWIAVAAFGSWRLQAAKRDLADASARIVAHLREGADDAGALRAPRTESSAGLRSTAP